MEEESTPQGSLPGTEPPAGADPGSGPEAEHPRSPTGAPPWRPLLNLLSRQEGECEEKALWLEDTYAELEAAVEQELARHPGADAARLRRSTWRRLTLAWYRAYVRRAHDRGERRPYAQVLERRRLDAVHRMIAERPDDYRPTYLRKRIRHAGPGAPKREVPADG